MSSGSSRKDHVFSSWRHPCEGPLSPAVLILHYLVNWQSKYSSWCSAESCPAVISAHCCHVFLWRGSIKQQFSKDWKIKHLFFENSQNYTNSLRRIDLGHRHRNEFHQMEGSQVVKGKLDFSIQMSFLTQNLTIAGLSSLLQSHCCLFNNSFWYFVICQNVPLWSHRLLTTL